MIKVVNCVARHTASPKGYSSEDKVPFVMSRGGDFDVKIGGITSRKCADWTIPLVSMGFEVERVRRHAN